MSEFSFKKEEKIRKKKDFFKTKKKGKKYSTKNFIVYILPTKTDLKRFGLAISAHTTGNIIKRNKIKRFLKEFFRLNKKFFPESSDIIVSLKKTSKGLWKYEEIKKEMTTFLEKTKKT